jgi:hypothetical protein
MKEITEKTQAEKQYFDKKISSLNSYLTTFLIDENVKVVLKFNFDTSFT